MISPPQAAKLHRGLIWKTVIASAVVVTTNVIGNYGLSRGLHDVGALTDWSPLAYIATFVHPWVVVGVIFSLAWLISRLVLLSWADLSYVLPVTSFSYVLSAVVGAVWLHENVSALHKLGICVITLGVSLAAFTYPETGPGAPEAANQ